METIPRRLDDLGKLVLPSELRRKLGLTLDPSPRVTITKLDDETLIIQKAKEGCQSPNTKELDDLGRLHLNKELRDSLGWNENTYLGVNDDIMVIRPLTPEQVELVKQKEEKRKSKATIVG
ncbi:MAG: hypothetical protein FWD97_05915 [Defluviitaleaceae bacterium]|nr:hypothetical protein [Defluviitaleaceae bacterium]